MTQFEHIVTVSDVAEDLAIKDIIRRNFNFSSRLRNKIKRNKLVFLNGKQVAGWIVPKEGDLILIKLPEETSYFQPEDIPIEVVYEDKDILAINKQPGLVVHPTYGCQEHTIANGIAQYMIDTDQSFKIRFINRLDMDTSGLLLLGKNSHAQDNFVKQQKLGMVKKTYMAIASGVIEEDMTVDAPIGRIETEGIRRVVTPDGRPSITHLKVLSKLMDKDNSLNNMTLIKLLLETGRTHQIRVHMNHIGHPLVGDTLYGGPINPCLQRQALHACGLSFFHPVTNQPIELAAPLPLDMTTVLNGFGQLNIDQLNFQY